MHVQLPETCPACRGESSAPGQLFVLNTIPVLVNAGRSSKSAIINSADSLFSAMTTNPPLLW